MDLMRNWNADISSKDASFRRGRTLSESQGRAESIGNSLKPVARTAAAHFQKSKHFPLQKSRQASDLGLRHLHINPPCFFSQLIAKPYRGHQRLCGVLGARSKTEDRFSISLARGVPGCEFRQLRTPRMVTLISNDKCSYFRTGVSHGNERHTDASVWTS